MSSSLTGCLWLASKLGWRLARGNVMVEGTSDVEYFEIAAYLYNVKTGLNLIGEDFSVFAAGEKDDGGAPGIMERFPSIFTTAMHDVDAASKIKYKIIAVADDDHYGKIAVNAVPKGHRAIFEYEHIFRLRRIMPLRAGSRDALKNQTRQANEEYGALDCVIEDLLSLAIIKEYQASNPGHLSGNIITLGKGHHAPWTPQGKSGLLKFTRKKAKIDDVELLVDVLKALRSYVGLPPEGIR
ncbi:hypothetical protein [Pseudomonas chlororaphis]|uniref:hypothetical protein n=1 Tax=Pseudomonas chlororaphis TaxID=587753 RepID=UPI000ABDED73|nr:hypothetical protein [Pseudomonas chlororaphis]AZD30739.1 hypothetical protein C4K23_3998 [Pseudomonas chlororaphis]QFS56096.1 hypothetical protein FD951_16660 [Pseudomonas chlororaphis subsp. aurantiaca]